MIYTTFAKLELGVEISFLLENEELGKAVIIHKTSEDKPVITAKDSDTGESLEFGAWGGIYWSLLFEGLDGKKSFNPRGDTYKLVLISEGLEIKP